MSKQTKKLSSRLVKFSKTSIWLFPLVLGLFVLLLAAFQIHGSSIGVYHEYFYGEFSKDEDLLLGRARGIRSDEWLVNTQKTIAQDEEDFPRVNENVANGEDESVIYDVPYKDWSTVFKPHNLGFLVLPFDIAFALKWWVMGYLLIISVYFFVLALLPKRRLLAATLGVAVFFTPFVQWWYQYATLGSIYNSLLIAVVLMALFKAKTTRVRVVLASLLFYLATSFALILYPPFQISCALAVAVFLLGYLLQNRKDMLTMEKLKNTWSYVVVALVASGATVLAFFSTRSEVVSLIQNTVYPGNRVVNGGDFDIVHLFSSHFAPLFQFGTRAPKYIIDNAAPHIANQSEASNFILLIPFLVIPSLILIYKAWQKKRPIDWPLLLTTGFFLLLLVRLLTPKVDIIYKLMLLDKVPSKRLVIGIGLLGFINFVLLMKHLHNLKKNPFARNATILYCLALYVFQVAVGFYVADRSPGFATNLHILALSIPAPVIVYLLLSRKYLAASFVFLAISVISSGVVNPVYRGTEVIRNEAIVNKIEMITETEPGLWAAESSYLQSFALLAGGDSISGVYNYPQLDIWGNVSNDEAVYNRYAHVDFAFEDNPNKTIDTGLVLVSGDHFTVLTDPCSDFIKQENVQYLITERNLSDSCVSLVEKFEYPQRSINIYRLSF